MTPPERIRALLEQLYGEQAAGEMTERILNRYPQGGSTRRRRGLDGSDSLLITYADTLNSLGERPLATLGRFLDERLPEATHVHVLPFFPSSGDGGFAIVDYRRVAPGLGEWEDIHALTERRGLMVDLVLNHVSVKSEWFLRFRNGDPEYRRWFHLVEPDADIGSVFRPRTHPLVTSFSTSNGPLGVWTTFSPEQVDLNYSHPAVLEEVIDVMMTYVGHGASVIRLDAVGYLWKEFGTSCLHHPKTHTVVKLLRAVLDHAAPHMLLVTETNVPHVDNVAYFGSDADEAHMVYNFSLPPLVLDAFLRQDTGLLSEWAAGLKAPGEGAFLNVLASHDGIGLGPARGLLSDEALEDLARWVEAAGGLWSGHTTSDGSVRPYELNIAFTDALGARRKGEDGDSVRRFLAAVSIQMSLRGVPGVYLHSALGTRSWWEGPETTGEPRSINRATLDADQLIKELQDPASVRSMVLKGHKEMLAARARIGAFDPLGGQWVHRSVRAVFSLIRTAGDGEAWCVTNVTPRPVVVKSPPGWSRRRCVFDGIAEEGPARLPGYGYRWYVR